MTFSTLASPGVSLQGGGGSGGGGGGTPGGSNTQIQYNSSGTFAGASGLTTNGTELTVASGTKTADAPVLDLSQTWNNGATTFTALKFNITDTASAAGSLLMDLQVGGSSRFNVGKTGSLKLGVSPTGTNQAGTNVIIAGSQGTGTGAGGSIIFQVAPAGLSGSAQNALATALTINADRSATFAAGITAGSSFYVSAGGISLGAVGLWQPINGNLTLLDTAVLGWSSTANVNTGNPGDVRLYRDAANTLALRNGANAQAFRVYSTFTDASNYERGALNAGADFIELAAETAGTGDDNLDVRLTPAGTGNVRFGTHTGTADTAVSGYIEIKDAGGTIRKLAVIT